MANRPNTSLCTLQKRMRRIFVKLIVKIYTCLLIGLSFKEVAIAMVKGRLSIVLILVYYYYFNYYIIYFQIKKLKDFLVFYWAAHDGKITNLTDFKSLALWA